MFLDSAFTMFLDMFPSKSQLKVALKRRYRATGARDASVAEDGALLRTRVIGRVRDTAPARVWLRAFESLLKPTDISRDFMPCCSKHICDGIR